MVERRQVTRTVKPVALDIGFSRSAASPEIQQKGKQLQEQMKAAGYDLELLHTQAEHAKDKAEKEDALQQIHTAAAVLFLHWSASRADQTTAFATAKHFNGLTNAARKLVPQSSEITHLHAAIAEDMRDAPKKYTPDKLAQALETAGQARKHEQAWPWVVLPTFPKQHYGRALVDVVEIPDVPYKVYVTQPTFVDGGATLLHTHGRNWAFARPLGQAGSVDNRHINTLWEPQSEQVIFPLRQVAQEAGGEMSYHAGDVVVILPKAIHGIEGSRGTIPACSLEEFVSLSPNEKEQRIKGVRFGELSSLHIYRADPQILEEDTSSKTVLDGLPKDEFFEMYDMIVLDPNTNSLWAGNGGAWERRMVTYGKTGEHCGKCFKCAIEGDNRSGELDPEVIKNDLLVIPSPGIIVYASGEKNENFVAELGVEPSL